MDDRNDGKCPDKDVCYVEGVRLGKYIKRFNISKVFLPKHFPQQIDLK